MENMEKKKKVESIAERFMQLDDKDMAYVTGYIAGKQEERQKWERRKEQVATM